MQEKSQKFLEFSERTEVLAKKSELKLSDLPEKIGLSTGMFHACRSGKYPISPKSWRKLEAAERAAGLIDEANNPVRTAESEGKVKDSDPPPYHFSDSWKVIAALTDQLAEKDRQIERLLDLLEARERRDSAR